MQEREGAAEFKIKVQPRAKRSEVIGKKGELLKIRVTAPPVAGKANEACLNLLANALDLPRAAVEIVAGERKQVKTIRVQGRSAEEVEKKLFR